jgi:hypothetical protein
MQNVKQTLEDGHTLVLRIDLRHRYGLSQGGGSVVVARSGGYVDVETSEEVLGDLTQPIGFNLTVCSPLFKKHRKELTAPQLRSLLRKELSIGKLSRKVAGKLKCGLAKARGHIGIVLGALLNGSLGHGEERQDNHFRVRRDGRQLLISRADMEVEL